MQWDLPRVLGRVQAIAQASSQAQVDELNALGVCLVQGTASFETAQHIAVRDAEGEAWTGLEGDAVILATGSNPVFLPMLKPDGKRIIAPRHVVGLSAVPDEVIVVGSGATGSETTYLFNRLGRRVTWIVGRHGVLPSFAGGAGAALADILARRGVTLVQGQRAEQAVVDGDGVTVTTTDGATYRAGLVFLAIGRRPDLAPLGLDRVGLQPNAAGALVTDALGRTAVPPIYAVGDTTGAPMLANKAAAQAFVAGRHAAGAEVRPFEPETVVYAIYTDPQVAQVGALNNGEGRLAHARLPYAAALKARIVHADEGFVEVAYDPGTRRLAGAVAVGRYAADVLAPVALALHLKATLDDLAYVWGGHPTLSELVFMAARDGAHG